MYSRSVFIDFKRRVFLEKSPETSAKQFSENSLKCDRTALPSCNLPNLHVDSTKQIPANEQPKATTKIRAESQIMVYKRYNHSISIQYKHNALLLLFPHWREMQETLHFCIIYTQTDFIRNRTSNSKFSTILSPTSYFASRCLLS